MSKDLSAEIGFSFEAVLAAVEDSDRGRWFLEEFKKRQNQAEYARVLDAISRIETRVDAMAGHFTAADDLAKVREAIATTRDNIRKVSPPAEGLSAEGRLFAQLAELARKTMPQAGIEKALDLVDQLDVKLNSNVTAFPASAAKSADRFFQQDAALFEQTAKAPAEPVKAVVQPTQFQKPAVEPVAMGAKLTITRAPTGDAIAQEPVASAPPEELVEQTVVDTTVEAGEMSPSEPVHENSGPAPAVTPVAPAAESFEPPKPRIVIIRRKPEEMPEVPAALQTSAA